MALAYNKRKLARAEAEMAETKQRLAEAECKLAEEERKLALLQRAMTLCNEGESPDAELQAELQEFGVHQATVRPWLWCIAACAAW